VIAANVRTVADWLELQAADRHALSRTALLAAASSLRALGDAPMPNPCKLSGGLDTLLHHATGSNSRALLDVASERMRQTVVEGHSLEHDDGHDGGELAHAAACYAVNAGSVLLGTEVEPFAIDEEPILTWWPWEDVWWKPKDPRRDLVRAAALIVAEIERLDRAQVAQSQ
jgi:hypothetical protein